MVKSTIYLGSTIGTRDTSKNEIERRISLGWKKYWSLGRIFKGPYSNRAKGMVFNANVVPVVTYGAQTWTLSKNLENKIRITQNAMERSMLNFKKKDRIRISKIKKLLNSYLDMVKVAKSKKWNWRGGISQEWEVTFWQKLWKTK